MSLLDPVMIGGDAVDDNDDDDGPMDVALGSNLSKRFYLPLILLVALGRVFRKANALRLPELETAPVDLFRTFVNKLAHICDSAKGGDKVTAFAIMQLGTVRYYFTSNWRDEEDYQRTTYYVTDVLNLLGQAQDSEVRNADGNEAHSLLFRRLLRLVIQFNQSRIKGYVCHMRDKLDFCIEFAQQEGSDDGELQFNFVNIPSLYLLNH